MKRLLTVVCGLIVLTACASCLWAQRNPRGKGGLILGGKSAARVEYGRPSLKGRTVDEMLGKLSPGQVWRLGADTSTTFSADVDLVVGGTNIPKGDYSVWARKEADNSWKLVFNKQHGQWGTEHDAAQDVAAVPLKQEKAAKSEETLSLVLAQHGTSGVFSILWGEMQLSADIKAK